MEQVGCNCDPEGGCGCFRESESFEQDEELDEPETDKEISEYN